MATSDVRIEPNTFGNLTVPRRSGLLGLSMGQSLMLVPIVLIVIVTAARGWIMAAVIIALATILGAVLLLVLSLRRDEILLPRWVGETPPDLLLSGMMAILLFQVAGYSLAWAWWWLGRR